MNIVKAGTPAIVLKFTMKQFPNTMYFFVEPEFIRLTKDIREDTPEFRLHPSWAKHVNPLFVQSIEEKLKPYNRSLTSTIPILYSGRMGHWVAIIEAQYVQAVI